MPIAHRQSSAPVAAQFEFEVFKSLPCGCVAAVHRTLDPGLSVVSLEAQGAYCGLMDHVMGNATAVPSDIREQFALTAEPDD
jgi:hypothetical protein